jgi:hypothetical protein
MAFQWNKEAAQAAQASANSFDALPIGSYRVIINKVEDKPTQKGGAYLKFELEVAEGQHHGRKIWTNINYKNDNPKAEEIGWRELGDLTRSIFGEMRECALHEYEGKVLRVETKHEEWNGEKQARVKKFLADGATKPQATTKPATKQSEDDCPF